MSNGYGSLIVLDLLEKVEGQLSIESIEGLGTICQIEMTAC